MAHSSWNVLLFVAFPGNEGYSIFIAIWPLLLDPYSHVAILSLVSYIYQTISFLFGRKSVREPS